MRWGPVSVAVPVTVILPQVCGALPSKLIECPGRIQTFVGLAGGAPTGTAPAHVPGATQRTQLAAFDQLFGPGDTDP